MRLKVGFLLRSLLVVGTFLGLVVLWSSLSPKPQDEDPFARRVSECVRAADPELQSPEPLTHWAPGTVKAPLGTTNDVAAAYRICSDCESHHLFS